MDLMQGEIGVGGAELLVYGLFFDEVIVVGVVVVVVVDVLDDARVVGLVLVFVGRDY